MSKSAKSFGIWTLLIAILLVVLYVGDEDAGVDLASSNGRGGGAASVPTSVSIERLSPDPSTMNGMAPAVRLELVHVLAVDQDLGDPVSGARFLSSIDGMVLGVTDDDGLSTLQVSEHGLTVVADGYFPREVTAGEVAEATGSTVPIRCLLAAAHELKGAAQWIDGRAGPEGMVVLAWPQGHPPTVDEALSAAARARLSAGGTAEFASVDVPGVGEQSESVLATLTDTAGGFLFSERVPAGRYTLTTGGQGAVASQRAVAVAEHDATHSLTVECVYGLGVQLLELDGGYLPISTAPYNSIPSWSFKTHDDVQLRAPQALEGALLDPLFHSWRERGTYLIQLMSSRPMAEAGPVRFHARYPGMRKQSTDVYIPRVMDQLELVSLVLEPSGAELGTLQVALPGWETHMNGTDPQVLNSIEVFLHPAVPDSDSQSMRCSVNPVTEVVDDAFTIHGLPVGDYRLELLLNGNHLKVRPAESVAVTEVGSRIEVALGPDGLETGSLVVQLLDRKRRPFFGRAYFEISEVRSGRNRDYLFLSHPYRIPVLSPGTYQARLVYASAGPRDAPSALSQPVEVQAGQSATLELAFDEGN